MDEHDLDLLIADLPDLDPPADLDLAILALIAQTPQDPPSVVDDLDTVVPAPANSNRRWGWAAGVVSLAAVALLAVTFTPQVEPIGDPADWTARGDLGAGPGVDLRIAVQGTDGSVERLDRLDRYEAGDTLLFRYDAHTSGHLTLVRIDDDGAEIVHDQQVGMGQGDLRTPGGLVGYALEEGESAAVFALIRSDQSLAPADVTDALAVGPDVERVCNAARSLGARCAAERLEAVR